MVHLSQGSDPDDARIRAALTNVPIPLGLEQRILARLRLSVADSNVVDRSADQMPSKSELPTIALQPATAADVRSPSGSPVSRRTWVQLSLALSLVAVAAGLWLWSQPSTPQHLAHYSLHLLDTLQSPTAQWQTEQVPWSQLGALNGQLRNSIRPVGFLDTQGGPIAAECRVWHLQSTITQKSFYVLDFRDSRSVTNLSNQLEAIDRVSGGWTMFAQRSGDRILVVLFEGAVSDYLVRPQSA